MTLPAWPAALAGKVQRSDWAVSQSGTAPVKTEMQAGNVRLRRQPGDRTAQMRVGFRLDAADLATFDAFVTAALAYATSRFTMTVWDGRQSVSKTVQIVDGMQGIQRAPAGRRTKISFTLIVYELF